MRNEDARSKRIIFVPNCLLNANNKVRELASYPGMFSEVVAIFEKYKLGVMQMSCPETLYLGNQRWHTCYYLYNNVGYRRFCRDLAKQQVDYMENYHLMGYQVVGILFSNPSPTCGLTKTHSSEEWGGKPKEVPKVIIDGQGVFTEELQKELESRDFPTPPFYALDMNKWKETKEQFLQNLDDFIAKQLDE